MPAGGVRLDGGPVLSENEASVFGSDVSSMISISDYVADTTDDDGPMNPGHDLHKYRMPDTGKTRLHLHTKEPLSPVPRSIPDSPTRRLRPSAPSTPRTEFNGLLASPGHVQTPSYFARRNLSVETLGDFDRTSLMSRAGSVYTLGRASFTGQLSQLTSMRLPDADLLTKRILSIPTAREAVRALADASEQIRTWISKASEVLAGLYAEDDVEWAAAGGREGIVDVDVAIARFEKLVEVYIVSIEQLQTRTDIMELSTAELNGSVQQMETIVTDWKKIKTTSAEIKEQVELAMEWERLWNTVLGEVGQELDALNSLTFEMEEKRHQGKESVLSRRDTIDLDDLETIIDQRPSVSTLPPGSRLSIGLAPPSFQLSGPVDSENDGTLLALFARMQPLRASLDFLPMRLSTFGVRGRTIFPTASADLDVRREQLETSWSKLKNDADALRGELGEDRWITVFRNAGRQALNMCESIIRSLGKLREALDAGEVHTNPSAICKKVDNYEAKKTHYGPAIERVLAIIDRGVSDRLTLNGEVLRLQEEMRRRWQTVQSDMQTVDALLDGANLARGAHLRDSVSTIPSSERSYAGSHLETPGSSPASSIMGLSRKGSFQGLSATSPSLTTKAQRRTSRHSSSSSTQPSGYALVSSSIPIRTIVPTKDYTKMLTPNDANAAEKATPARPRWSMARYREIPTYTSLRGEEPSPYAKTPVTPRTNFLRASRAPASAPNNARRDVSTPVLRRVSAIPMTLPPQRKSSLPVPRAVTPTAHTPPTATRYRPASRLSSGRRSALAEQKHVDGHEADTESPSHHRRPPSVLHVTRKRSSVFQSSAADSATNSSARPPWRL